MDFVAVDIETADSANSAPCAIGLVTVCANQITHRKGFLINPEAKFNPIAMKIHKITPEMVADAPTLPEVWDEICTIIRGQTLVFHGAGFDVSVIEKATDRYALSLPSFEYRCTLEVARQHLTCKDMKLKTVCKTLGIVLEKAHDALADATACAEVAIKLLELGADFSDGGCVTSVEDIFDELPDFEKGCLREVYNILAEDSLITPLTRWVREKFLCICFPFGRLRIGKVKGRYFLAVSDDYMNLMDLSLDHDAIKAYNRFYLDAPSDLRNFTAYFNTKVSKNLREFEEYKQTVSERTIQKHTQVYRDEYFPFSESLFKQEVTL